ncbi:tripartite tricarboxylate transporter substrate binding protein [Sporomusa sp.]|uniref:tripartite tricarboxylate transporter substrate binding protein n=1 Tax=Sporomusa sp. TaxID=2078658 RepID=UPI002D1117C9|nr:tripartite tricarboxylate transporter substrate binding protein [Sporomusa sp.]HWR07566.1 tripartite tricarboxylate transporter substrate binding protein [Sporomusa sp.]
MQSTPVTTTLSKFPEKPITTIVPFGAGGGLDLTTRSLEKIALNHLGQPLIIINKPGSAGALGWNELAGASPDGYTIGATSSEMVLLSLYGSGKYNYLTALTPLAQVTSLPMLLAVQADKPWRTLNDLIDYAKQHPGELKFGNAGVGSFAHVLGEMFSYDTGINTVQVPFSGGGEMTTALLGGHVQLIFVNPVSIKEHVKNGTVRILALTGEHRLNDSVFVQVPTFKEQGFDITLTNWHGVAVPKELPMDVKNKLEEKFKTIIMDPEFTKNMSNIGMPVEYLGSQDAQSKWQADSQKLQKTLQESGILEQIKAQRK